MMGDCIVARLRDSVEPVAWSPFRVSDRNHLNTGLGIEEDEGVGESREQCPADPELLGDIDEARE
jgi:hypothetical protein